MRCLAAAVLAALILSGCGSGGSATRSVAARASSVSAPAGATSSATAETPIATSASTPPAPPKVLPTVTATGPIPFEPAYRWHGQTAVWIARSANGVALMSFDQRYVTLALHSGTLDAGGSGWKYGPAVQGAERGRLIAAFNSGFKFNTGAGGFESAGRTALPLRAGRASIVTYGDGHTDIGTWGQGVPAAGASVDSVRQNLTLLIDNGRAASNLACLDCWGPTLHGVNDPARSALGVTADGHLIWAGGEHLTAAALAAALLGARVVKAVELDINPEWVAGYLYGHGPLRAFPIVPGQPGVYGTFLLPYSRDFFTVLGR